MDIQSNSYTYNNYNQKRSQKSTATKHTATQRQQQQQQLTSSASVVTTGAAVQSPHVSTSTTYNNNSNESCGFKKKYKYNTHSFGNNANNFNTVNNSSYQNLSSRSLRWNSANENSHFSANYSRSRRSYYNKHRYGSGNAYSYNGGNYSTDNYQRSNNNNSSSSNKQFTNSRQQQHSYVDNNFQYFNFGKYHQSSFIQFPSSVATCSSSSTTAAAAALTSNLAVAASSSSTPSNILNVPYEYAQLPNVVLAKIYSYLPLKDRLNASASCQSWRSGLFNNPCLWTSYDLVIYLCNKLIDLKSSHFKLKHFAKLTKNCVFKFDSNDLTLIEKLTNSLELIKSNEPNNLKCLTLAPLFSFDSNDDAQNSLRNTNDYFDSHFELEKKERLKLRLFKSIKELMNGSKVIEHLALGFLSDVARSGENLLELVNELDKKQSQNLKSLHISSIKKSSVLYLSKLSSVSAVNKSVCSPLSMPPITLSSLVEKFSNLKYLSIDFNDLTDDLIRSEMFVTSLKKLNLNVNNLNNTNETKSMQRNQAWLYAASKNPNLRVAVNVLVQEDFARKYNSVLSSNIPLETLRMYFCKSFNPEIIQFLSDSYSDTLQSLCIVDSIVEPTLRYHNPLRFDAEPDPLILLCWKCKSLQELVVVGYEMLEINLIAIAKLRANLKKFHVAMDCIIDLKYGKFRNDDFIEDEEGEDTIVDYGFCSDQVIDKVCKILGSQNWHPLEKEELPLSVYDFDVPYEEAYLETLVNEQAYSCFDSKQIKM